MSIESDLKKLKISDNLGKLKKLDFSSKDPPKFKQDAEVLDFKAQPLDLSKPKEKF